jgi:hypothetical protein
VIRQETKRDSGSSDEEEKRGSKVVLQLAPLVLLPLTLVSCSEQHSAQYARLAHPHLSHLSAHPPRRPLLDPVGLSDEGKGRFRGALFPSSPSRLMLIVSLQSEQPLSQPHSPTSPPRRRFFPPFAPSTTPCCAMRSSSAITLLPSEPPTRTRSQTAALSPFLLPLSFVPLFPFSQTTRLSACSPVHPAAPCALHGRQD